MIGQGREIQEGQDKEDTYKKDRTSKRNIRMIGQGKTYKKDRTMKRHTRRIRQGRDIQEG